MLATVARDPSIASYVPSRYLRLWARRTVWRPYYLCPHCHQGQFPAEVELDIENTEFSPGVRRMQALVGRMLASITAANR